MGLPVAVNIAVLEFVTNSEKAIQRFWDLVSSISFQQPLSYKRCCLERMMDIIGLLIGLFFKDSVYFSLVPIAKDGGPAIFASG